MQSNFVPNRLSHKMITRITVEINRICVECLDLTGLTLQKKVRWRMFRNKMLKKCSALRERYEGSSRVGGEVTKAYLFNEAFYWFNISFYHGSTAPVGLKSPHYWRYMITLRHTTLGRTPLDEWSARRRDLFLTTHNTHNGQTSMPPARFGPTIPANERPQSLALDSAATGIGCD